MVRLNLQLFAKSVNDIAKEVIRGNWGNGNERKEKLTAAGYNYSEVQSVVNSMLNGNNTKTTTTTNTNNNKNTSNVSNTTTSSVKGVDQATVDKAYNSTFTQSDGTKAAESKKNDALTNYTDYANKTDIVDQSVYDTLNSEFVVPEAVTQADAWLKTQLEKIQSGRTSYTDQINSLMNDILNREDFEYDVDKDTLFQQALASAMSSGKSAMQDTIGQASALTGGYGSTYATSAGNQAYNAFIEDAYNNLPEYYQMALQAYQMEGQEMYNQFDMLTAADANEWNKLVTGYDATSQYRNQVYNEAYTTFRDKKTDALNTANLQISEFNTVSSNLYNIYNAYSNEYENQYAKEYQSWADEVSMAQSAVQTYQTDYWNQTELDYKKEQDKIAQSNWEKEYNLSLAAANAKVDNSTGNVTVDNTGTNTDDIPKEVNTKASKFKTDAELESYLDAQVEAGIITESQADYLYSVNKTPASSNSSKKWYEQDWTISKDTKNWNNWFSKGNEDYNDKYKVGKDGQEYTYEQLKNKINSEAGLSDAEKKAFLKKLRDQSLK